MKDKRPVIFYSWQSDHDKTRNFIENALRNAIKSLSENPDIELSPRFDKDTQGKVGSINIPTTIRKKIDSADVFVADVSLVDEGKTGRAMVNQNVMYELGYAAGKITEEATVTLQNTDLIEGRLPFDIEQNRVVSFSITEDKKGSKLTKRLEVILSEHLEDIRAKRDGAIVESVKDKLERAVEDGKPGRRLAETYFTQLYSRINNLYPGRRKYTEGGVEYSAKIAEAYDKSLPNIHEFYNLISLATEYKKEDVLIAAYQKLEILSKYFDTLTEDTGGLSEDSRDYHALIIYELTSIIFGCVAREKWWSFLETLTSVRLKRPNKYDRPIGLERLYHFPQGFDNRIKKNNIRSIIYMIEKRHTASDDLLQTYIDGSLLVWFLVDNPAWSIYLLVDDDYSQHYRPQFIKLFKKHSFVNKLFVASNCKTLEEFKDRVWSHVQRNVTGWPDGNMASLFEMEGIKAKTDIGSERQKIELI